MPTYKTQVEVDTYTDAEVEISPDDFLYECSTEELKEICTILQTQYPEYYFGNILTNSISDAVMKIYRNTHQLTSSEDKIIEQIAKRFI